MSRVIALVDCNNFYASCERVFAPKLEGHPIVVLSNNDACIVARSNESKKLGIPMGAPWHQIRKIARQHGVQAFSSNYALYGDMSARVMNSLTDFTPEVEIYSIDEAFLDLTGTPESSLTKYGRRICKAVHQRTGIPVSVGIASTKTLAKIANKIAKKNPETGGVLDLEKVKLHLDSLLTQIPVGDIWGVGGQWSKRLLSAGITNGRELRDADTRWIRSDFNVVLERTVLELRGQPCIEFENVPPKKQQIMCSRSFGTRLTNKNSLREAVCSYITNATEKLRKQKSKAQAITVFIQTSMFNKKEPRYSNSCTVPLGKPSNDTGEIINLALSGLDSIFRPGYSYARAGIMLLDLVPDNVEQGTLFPSEETETSGTLMNTLDGINQKHGKGKVRFATEGFEQKWQMNQNMKSPAYTTRWSDLPKAGD
jgi:DNA polymerase V